MLSLVIENVDHVYTANHFKVTKDNQIYHINIAYTIDSQY